MKRIILFIILIECIYSCVSFSKSENNIEDEVALMFTTQMPHFEECKAISNEERDLCTRALINKYIAENFRVSEKSKKRNETGTVYVQFIVGKKGEVRDVKVLKGATPDLDKSSLRAVRKLPDFIPGLNDGKPVSIMYQIPIRIY